jgi:hypothetical protein
MRPPPGYPFVGPLQSRPPPKRDPEEEAVSPLGLAGFVLAFAGGMAGIGFLLVAILVSHVSPPGAALVAPQTTVASGSEGAASDGAKGRVVDAPLVLTPPRNVPIHPARFLEGCGAEDLDAIEESLNASIAHGAPLFNDGDAAACVVEYVHDAQKLESTLPASCSGPRAALAEGRAAATKVEPASAAAWAMRDAFDGLLEVIERSRVGGVSNL